MIGGIVVRGDGLGRQYGFPTANLDCPQKDVKIPGGIYAAWAFFDRKKYKAALVIQDEPWKVEVHLIDFGEEIYGRHMEVEPVQKVAEMQPFETEDEIVSKIHDDITMVKEMLKDKE